MASDISEQDVKLTMTKICLTADYYTKVCPALARSQSLLLSRIKEKYQDPSSPASSPASCQHCGQIFRPNNHSIHTQPRVRESRRGHQLAKVDPRTLNKRGLRRNLHKLYTEGYNSMHITCHGCKKVCKTKLYSRAERLYRKPEEPQEEPAKLTKSQKKKLKAKKRMREREPEADTLLSRSGKKSAKAETKHLNHEAVTPSASPALSKPSPKEQPKTSTPQTSSQTPKSSTVTPKPSPNAFGSHQTTPMSLFKGKNKKKKTLSTLQTLLSQAELEKKRTSTSSLSQFLGSL